MKKKMMGLMLVVAMTLISTISVFADTVSEDALVQSVYNAYNEIKSAMDELDYSRLENGYDQYMDILAEFTDEQEEEWNRVVQEKIGVDNALACLYNASCIVYADDMMDNYETTPNAKTAYEFIDAYDNCKDLELPIDDMIPTMKGVYDMAKSNDMPSEHTLAVYKAYWDVVEAIESGYADNLDDAIEGFENVVDFYNELSDEEFADLAVLLEITSEDPELTDGEYIAQVIFADWMNINILDSIDKVYSDYVEEPNEANAEALVGFYELVFPEDGGAAISSDLVEAFFPGIDEIYLEAKAVLAGEENPDGTGDEDDDPDDDVNKEDKKDDKKDDNKGQGNDKTDKTQNSTTNNKDNTETKAPKTGDGSSVQMLFVAMFAALMAVGLVVKKETY